MMRFASEGEFPASGGERMPSSVGRRCWGSARSALVVEGPIEKNGTDDHDGRGGDDDADKFG